MTDKFPNFEYVPELADYMLKQIVKSNAAELDEHPYYVYSFHADAPERVLDAWSALPGTHEERYAALLELSDADNTDDGVEEYLCYIEAPCYYKDLLDWLLEDDHTYDVDDALKEYGGDIGLMGAIALAWCRVRADELRAVAESLEEYLNCGDDDNELEGNNDDV